MAEQDAHVSNVKSYTEATHTAYADVTPDMTGVEPITAGSRAFAPGRITVHYNWRTQLGDEGWKVDNIEISGPWMQEPAAGSGHVILGMYNAPDWVRVFAEANMPTATLVDGGGERDSVATIDYSDLDRICSALREHGSEADMALLRKLRGLREGTAVEVTGATR